MVDEVITKQELIDAQKDAQSLDDFINGGEEQIVVTRLLKEYPTLANAIRQIYEKGGKFYPTLADANADIANIRTDVYVITGDNGAYYKATAEATSLTKSPYDPLTLASNRMDANRLFNPFRQDATDFNTVLTPGFNLIVSSASATTEYNAPIQKPGLLRVLKASGSGLVSQVYEPFDGSGAFYRTYDGSVFTPWISQWDSTALSSKLANFLPKEDAYLLSTALNDKDLNTVVKFGIYSQSSSSLATLERNYPVARSGFLEVLQGSGTSIIMQRYTTILWGDIQTYVRYLISGVWGEWKAPKALELDISLQRKIPARAEFLFPDGLSVTFNVDTRILSWDKTVLFATAANATNRVNLSAGSIDLSNAGNFSVVYIDLTALPENGNITDPATSPAVKVGTYSSGYYESMTHIPIAKMRHAAAGTKVYACAGFPEIINIGSGIAPENDSSVELLTFEKSENSLVFYNKGSSSNYMKHTFNRSISSGSNLNAWGMAEAYKVNSDFATIKEVVTAGVWETALMPADNIDDHSGGTHGDEILSSAYFLIDGIYVDQAAVKAGVCKTIQAVQKSQVFIEATQNLFCEKLQVWTIDVNKMTLDVELNFPNQVDTMQLWIGMLPILRENVTSKQIRSTNFDVVDISTTSFPRNEEPVESGNYVVLSGDDVSVKVTVEKIETPLSPFWFVTNSALYNKLYVSASSRDVETISAGSKIRVRTTYEFNVV